VLLCNFIMVENSNLKLNIWKFEFPICPKSHQHFLFQKKFSNNHICIITLPSINWWFVYLGLWSYKLKKWYLNIKRKDIILGLQFTLTNVKIVKQIIWFGTKEVPQLTIQQRSLSVFTNIQHISTLHTSVNISLHNNAP
jgi:hypothetical protein